MNYLILVLFLGIIFTCAGNEEEKIKEELIFTLTPEAEKFQLGENVALIFKVANKSSQSIVLVKILDGSNGRRQPLGKVTLWGPDGQEVKPLKAFCGNTNPLSKKDFISVNSGAEADLSGFGLILNNSLFKNAGKYKVQLEYSTMNDEFEKWVGGPMGPEGVEEIKGECLELFNKRFKTSKTLVAEFEIVPAK